MSEYEYIPVGRREVRATTGPPAYNVELSDLSAEYVYSDVFSKKQSDTQAGSSKTIETSKPRKKSIDSIQTSKNKQSCFKNLINLEPSFKHLGKKKSDTTPKHPKLSKDQIIQTSTTPRQAPLSNPSFTHSKSVENLEETFPSTTTPLQVPFDTIDTEDYKSKSSSMNFLHIFNTKQVVSPLTNYDSSEPNQTSAPPTNANRGEVDHIYEELDDITKKEIIKETDLNYVVFQSPLNGRIRPEDRFTAENRPPEPLPQHIRGSNQQTLFPNSSKQKTHSLSRDVHKAIPPQKPPITITTKISENILDNTRIKKHPPVPEKPNLIKKSLKELSQSGEKPTTMKTNSQKQFSDIPTTITSLSRDSSIKFTIPLNIATSIPLYSLQRSQNITSEIQTVTDIFVGGFDDDFIDDDDPLLFNFKSQTTDISSRLAMEASLSSFDSTDYATYDRILREINTYSKRATIKRPNFNCINSVDYVTYDKVINLTRSHSADLEGYVTTEMMRSNQAKSSLPNSKMEQVEYINTEHTQPNEFKCKHIKTWNPRPNKSPKPQPRTTKPVPPAKPVLNVSKSKGNTPSHIVARASSFEDPGYVGEDTACLQPPTTNRENLVQSFHEYADSQIIDNMDMPGDSFFKSSRRRKSILKPSGPKMSRDSSIYTNYIDNSHILRSSQKRNYAEAPVEYDYVCPVELRIPFRVSWAPLFFEDDFSYVPSMEVAKLLSALNVTNHINEGWDFHQYSTVVNSKAAKPPPPIHPKTDSLLRENNKRLMPFRPSLNCTPEDESVVSIARRGPAAILTRSNRISFRSSFPLLSQMSSTNSTDSVFDDQFYSLPITPAMNTFKKSTGRGKFPSKPMLPPSKEVPELNSSMPITTPCSMDENGDSITRSHSASKIELSQFNDALTEVQSHTLNRYQQKQKKSKQSSTDSDKVMKKGSVEQNSFDNDTTVFTRLPSRPSLEREKFEMRFSTTILLEEDNIIQVPSSAVSFQITIDSMAVAKTMGGEQPIEFIIRVFTNYSYWDSKLDSSKKGLFREKSVNLSPIVSISCNKSPPPNLGNMLLTIPICGQIDGWLYLLCQKDVDNLYGSERKDTSTFKLCDDRVEISTPLFGYYCIKGKYSEKSLKQICVKKVVFIAFRGLFNLNKILIGMCNDTPDDTKLYKEEMHDRHYRAIKSEPCQYLLTFTPTQQPLRISLKIDGKTNLTEMEIPFITAWKMVPNIGSGEAPPPTPSCIFTLPTPSHIVDLTVRHGQNCVHYSLNT
ncbi:hypothetical protein LOD99_13434 [Oopsacas minuta]|uniref:Uncharacterized protein n=1 Tax=Oopsacas minuta TaxID=111878 RepID=A0AAV7KKU5_9METZ|nr:hypothetical protein LOD99_13434 [Oopsacas minuta]